MNGRAVILLIRPRPESLSYRPWLQTAGDGTLLQWAATRIRSECRDARPVALVGEPEAALYRAALESAGFTVLADVLDAELPAVLRAAADLDAGRAIVVYPEAAFAPEGVLAHLARSDSGDWATVEGLPADATPVAINRPLLETAVPLLETMAGFAGARRDFGLRASLEFTTRIAATLTDDIAPVTAIRLAHPRVTALAADDIPAILSVDGPVQTELAQRIASTGEPALAAWAASDVAGRFRDLPPVCPPDSARARVLYVSNASMITGGQRALAGLIAGLDRVRFEPVAMLGHEGAVTESLAAAGCPVICPNRSFNGSDRRSFEYVLATLDAVRPALVHINDFSGMPIMHAAAARGIPIVFHVRVPGAHLLREALWAADHVVAVSEPVRQDVMRNGVRADKVTTVLSGINSGATAHNPSVRARGRSRFEMAADNDMVVMVGRYHPIKRHDILLEAMALVRRERPSVRCVLVGETDFVDSTLSALRMQAGALGLIDVVQFRRFERDMTAVYAAADVCVLCSDREPLGISALEAMAHEVPLVLSTDGALADALQGAPWASVVPRGEPALLARAIARLLEDADWARTAAVEGRRFVEDRYGTAAMVRGVEAVYDRMLPRSIGPRRPL